MDIKTGQMAVEATHAKFREMKEGTQEDWALISKHYLEFAADLPDRVLTHLKLLEGDFGGFPVCRMEHSLQTATRAHRDGRGERYVVMALLHDIGDTLGTYNHPEVAAAILKPFVTEQEHWICQHHGAFQGYYFFHHLNMDREMHKAYIDHPCYQRTQEFVRKYDAPAFDPELDTLPLEFFEPMIRKVFERPVRSIYKQAQDKITAE